MSDSSLLVIIKAAILLFCFAIFHFGIHPPTPLPEKREVVFKGQLFEYAPRALIYLWQVRFP
jgi:hypothetical protein